MNVAQICPESQPAPEQLPLAKLRHEITLVARLIGDDGPLDWSDRIAAHRCLHHVLQLLDEVEQPTS